MKGLVEARRGPLTWEGISPRLGQNVPQQGPQLLEGPVQLPLLQGGLPGTGPEGEHAALRPRLAAVAVDGVVHDEGARSRLPLLRQGDAGRQRSPGGELGQILAGFLIGGKHSAPADLDHTLRKAVQQGLNGIKHKYPFTNWSLPGAAASFIWL